MSTRELILDEALKQFSEKGYAGTSMSDIAKPIGISKAALYKHFESKQQIFEEIIEQSEVRYGEFLDKLSVHFDGGEKDVDVFGTITSKGLCESVLTFVRFSMNDTYSRQVRRMMTISQFESKELGELYTKRYVSAMLGYDEKLFERLMAAGAIEKGDPKYLALMFFAPVIMYMGIWDREPNRAEECEAAIKDHVEKVYKMTKKE